MSRHKKGTAKKHGRHVNDEAAHNPFAPPPLPPHVAFVTVSRVSVWRIPAGPEVSRRTARGAK